MCAYEIHWHIHNHVCFNRETILYTLNILIIGFSPPVALVSHHFLYTLPFIYFSIFYHVRCSNLHLVKTPTQAYYSAESQNTPLLRYSNDSFIRLQNTHPFLLLNIPQTAENQGFLESRQTVSIFAWTLILYCLAKVYLPYQKWGEEFSPTLYQFKIP